MPEIISEPEKIETLSEDVQEIIGSTPRWIVRWGITVILCTVVFLLGGSMVFIYPDIITSEITILSENPPVSIVARSTGKIDTLLVKDGQLVKQGDPIAVIENTANFNHVILLMQKLKTIERQHTTDISYDKFSQPHTNYSLGPVQKAYSSFVYQCEEFSDYVKLSTIEKKMNSLKQQIKDYKKYGARIDAQSKILEKTERLNYNQFKRDSTLFVSGAIASADLERSEQNWLQAKNNYQSSLAQLANIQMDVNQLEYNAIELIDQRVEQSMKYNNLLYETYQSLITEISEWNLTYVLSSPIDGEITFNDFWNHNQFVTSGDAVFHVVPVKPQSVVGRIKIPVSGSGKVQAGQRVLIRLDNYPFTEYGMIEGKIISISLIPVSSGQSMFYTAEVELIKGLTTNYRIELPFNQEMKGTGEIITRRLSLFKRLINPLKYTVKKSL
ncbi:MAG TPA: HlyD family efflux transporter periplasmic adaptor subunit [Ignavibacteria bacterium]|nr:HlyD family efflux transporter periplasmic adaptor subunit [Ignavibacteria bacterium]